MENRIGEIGNYGILPTVELKNTADAKHLADALRIGGLPWMTVLYHTPKDADIIRALAAVCSQTHVGAKVFTVDQAGEAISAGAEILTCPEWNPDIVRLCTAQKFPLIPGCSSIEEIQQAADFGFDAVGVYPERMLRGVETFQTLSRRFPKIRFMLMGNISIKTMKEYLPFENILACEETQVIVKEKSLRSGDFDEISDQAIKTMQDILGFTFDHLGIDTESIIKSKETAEDFFAIFGFDIVERSVSFFAGPSLEIMKKTSTSAHGHIAFSTRSFDRTYFWLRTRGYGFDESSRQTNAGGKIRLISLDRPIAGFTIQIIWKSPDFL